VRQKPAERWPRSGDQGAQAGSGQKADPAFAAVIPTQWRFVVELISDIERLLAAAAPLALDEAPQVAGLLRRAVEIKAPFGAAVDADPRATGLVHRLLRGHQIPMNPQHVHEGCAVGIRRQPGVRWVANLPATSSHERHNPWIWPTVAGCRVVDAGGAGHHLWSEGLPE
jgi:hypothetical protein